MNIRIFIYSSLLFPVAISCSRIGIDEPQSSSEIHSIVASYEGNTRTSLETSESAHSAIIWNAQDAIFALLEQNPSEGVRFVAKQSGETTTFEGTLSGPSGKVAAIYPYRDGISYAGGAFSTELPSNQLAVADNFDPASFISVASGAFSSGSDQLQLCFYNACGGLRFTVSDSNITRIVFRGNDNESIAGSVSISETDSKVPLARVSSGGLKSISLASETPLVPGSFYYITLPPIEFQKGFTFEFYNGNSLLKTTRCSAYVCIKRSVFSSLRNADNQQALNAIKGGFNLAASGSANCYVVDHAGQFKFPVVKGNSDVSPGSASKAEVLWETDNTASKISAGAIISKVELSNSYVYFETPGTLHNGNALIAVKDANGVILWTWHIWVCSGYDPEATAQRYMGKPDRLLDRNLGALSGTMGAQGTYGLLYQWGRKDPFVGFVSMDVSEEMYATSPVLFGSYTPEEGTVAYTIAHPTTFICADNDWHYGGRDNTLWAASKTIYDPCPPGWKIPLGYTSGVWYYADEVQREQYLQVNRSYCGATIALQGGGYAWYPATGYRNDEGQLTMNGKYGSYWSYFGDSQKAWVFDLTLYDGNYYANGNSGNKARSSGRSVRCVAE